MMIRKIQCELKAPKDKRNSFGNYNYRSAEGILEAVKPLLDKYESYITLSDELVYVGDRYYVKATATLCTPDRSYQVTAYAREEETKKGMDASQITVEYAESSLRRNPVLRRLVVCSRRVGTT